MGLSWCRGERWDARDSPHVPQLPSAQCVKTPGKEERMMGIANSKNSEESGERGAKKRGSSSSVNLQSMHVGRNRVFTWIPCEIGEETLQIAEADVVQQHGVPLRVLVQGLRTEIENQARFLSMPLAIILVIVYSVSLAYHDGASTVRDVEDAISFGIKEKTDFGEVEQYGIDDAHSIAGIYSWLRLGLSPHLFKREYDWSDDLMEGEEDLSVRKLPAQNLGSYLQYNKIVGGVVLDQARAVNESCSRTRVADTLDMVCQPAEEATGIPDLHMQPNHFQVVSSEPLYDPQLTRWFLIQESAQSIESRLKQLELSQWIDYSTAQVSIRFMSYNAHFDALTLTGIHFYFARSGKIWSKITHETYILELFQTNQVVVADVFFVLIIFWLFASEVTEFVRHVGTSYRMGANVYTTLVRYVDFWNVVDWVTIGVALALAIMAYRYGHEIQNLKSELIRVTDLQKSGESQSVFQVNWRFEWADGVLTPELEMLMAEFHVVHKYYQMLRLMTSSYLVALVLRLFKAFHAQPRMSIVTRTLMKCSVDLGHFALVLFTVYSSLAVMGMALFGREMEDFCTFSRALSSCFIVLMGDFDMDAKWEVGRPLAMLWFGMFNIMVLLIMLNMLLAIIMDAYSEVKANVQSSDTLYFELATWCRRWWELRTGKRLKLRDVYKQLTAAWTTDDVEGLEALEEEGLQVEFREDEIVSVIQFQHQVTGLGQIQAKRLMEKAVRDWRMEKEEDLTLSQVMQNTNNLIVRRYEDLTHEIGSMHEKIAELPLSDQSLQSKHQNLDISKIAADRPEQNVRLEEAERCSVGQFIDPSLFTVTRSGGLQAEPKLPSAASERLNVIETRVEARIARLETNMEARLSRLEATMERLTSAIVSSHNVRLAPESRPTSHQVAHPFYHGGCCTDSSASGLGIYL